MTPQAVMHDLVGHLLNEIDRDPASAPRFERLSNVLDVWSSMLFCILSSQVRAPTAVRAVQGLLKNIPFFDEALSADEVYVRSKHILQSREIRYRFPEARSRQIANSWFAFAQIGDEIYSYLDSFAAEKAARTAVTLNFSGLGLKQASMFLRDIGYSKRLCVIDAHILWYCERMKLPVKGALTVRRYHEIEEFLLVSADAFGASANVFDSVVWTAVKAFKGRQCSMQFA